jgi:hypothetical protein
LVRDWTALPANFSYLLTFCWYRYRDSNPGFRRERAAS